MKNLILPILIIFPILGYCQFNPKFSQRINSLELINPGLIASKKDISSAFLNRFNFPGDYMYVAGHSLNIILPVPKWNAGFGMNFFSEIKEIRSNVNFDLISSINLKISRNAYLDFGIMGGLELDKKSCITKDVNTLFPENHILEEEFSVHGGFGLNFISYELILGTAFHYNQLTEYVTNQNEHYTLFLNGSYLFEVDTGLGFKPTVLYQYWNKTNVIDYGLSVVIEDCLTLGVYNRWNQAIILYGHIILAPLIGLAYSYDFGINEETKADFGYSEIKIELILPSKKRKGQYTLFGI